MLLTQVYFIYPYLYLSFGHNLICDLSIFFALFGFDATLLIAEQPQCLRALQFNLEFLSWKKSVLL